MILFKRELNSIKEGGMIKMTNINLFKKKIYDSGMTVTAIARKTGISRETLYNRMKLGDFRSTEIFSLTKVLQLSQDERDHIFFANDGELKSTKYY